MNINPKDFPQKDVYAVIGNPIAHSKSPQIHHLFAAQTQQNIQYGLLFSELSDFEETVTNFFKAGGKGLNVTVPFKNRAYAMCDQLTDYAKAAGVVNILWMENGQLMGDNSDGLGLVKDLQGEQANLSNQSVLILGAGGAVQGVILPFIEAGVMSIVIVNRTFEKAVELVERFTPQADARGVHLGALESHWVQNFG
jgi:shikimate dehydrogenase